MASSSSSSAAAAAPTADDKARAEAFKAEGNGHHKAGQYGSAIDAYSKAIAADPSNPAYYSNRGAARMMINRFEDAISDCDKAIELKPDFVKAYMRGATARLRTVSPPAAPRSVANRAVQCSWRAAWALSAAALRRPAPALPRGTFSRAGALAAPPRSLADRAPLLSRAG